MTFTPNKHYADLMALLTSGKLDISLRSADTDEYKKFIAAFPATSVASLTMEQYCLGTGKNDSFCWWVERGLEPVLGRYSPGTSKGHVLYYLSDGSIYKNQRLEHLSNKDALEYTLKVQSAIINADPTKDFSWIDDDEQIYQRAGVKPIVTIGGGRKLRLLSCYHPDQILPISSSDHLAHFLTLFGLPKTELPSTRKFVARLQLLNELYQQAKEQLPSLSTFAFMKALYSDEFGHPPPSWEAAKDDEKIDDKIDDKLDDQLESKESIQEMTNRNTLNTILFGPPGTGKTYSVVDEALRILDPALFENKTASREDYQQAFKQFVVDGRIVVCTFHQSFSYEDFVEGITATSSVDKKIEYNVEPGILKRICEKASAEKGIISIDQAIANFSEKISETPITLSTPTGKKFLVSYKYPNTTFTCIPESSATQLELPANIEHVRQVLNDIQPSNIYCESYVKGIVSYLKTQNIQPNVVEITHKKNSAQPYVLIIDEINRGNISKIFGELISLIEPSKRAGAAEALSVTLPYSKKHFSVPNNLYLVGTMNTADRSLAGLDIALRRRFTFKEMPPKPELLDQVIIEGVNIGQLLGTMNERIEVLLDRDHCLGHAYFMPLKNTGDLDTLKQIFRQQILPLLQEYFFEDWERIAWVLNDQNKPEKLRFIQQTKGNLATLFGAQIADTLQMAEKRWHINKSAFDDINSYRAIIKVAP